jgi:hypothetical protein
MKKSIVLSMLVLAAFAARAEVLFYTDFKTTPAGFKAASAVATAMSKDDTLVSDSSGASAPHDTVIDGCTLSANKSSTTLTMILISKASQSFPKLGDTVGCTSGRLSLKNSGNFIKFPSVTGPCTFTYYAAASSATAGRGFQCLVNDVSTPDAGISELTVYDSLKDTTLQITKKVVYPCAITGPVVFTLIANGGVYLYDVKIESGAVVGIKNMTNAKNDLTIRQEGLFIKNSKNSYIAIFNVAGVKIFASNKSAIDLKELSKSVYVARIAGTGEKIRIVR